MVTVGNKSLGASSNPRINVAQVAVARTGRIKSSYQEEALVEAQERREFRRQQTEARKKQEQLVASKRSQQRRRSAANYRQELKSLIREVLKEHTDEYSLAYRAKLESGESDPTQDQSLRDSERPSRLAEAGTAQPAKSATERVPRILDPDQSSDAPESGK